MGSDESVKTEANCKYERDVRTFEIKLEQKRQTLQT